MSKPKKKKKTNPLVCNRCGSMSVDVEAWVSANTNKFRAQTEDGSFYCNRCNDTVIPILKSEYEKEKKVKKMVSSKTRLVNEVALACDLADEKLLQHFKTGNIYHKKITVTDKEGNDEYTKTAQKIFDKWYDHYMNMINECKN